MIDKEKLIEVMEPFLEEHCTEYVKEMVLWKIKNFPEGDADG